MSLVSKSAVKTLATSGASLIAAAVLSACSPSGVSNQSAADAASLATAVNQADAARQAESEMHNEMSESAMKTQGMSEPGMDDHHKMPMDKMGPGKMGGMPMKDGNMSGMGAKTDAAPMPADKPDSAMPMKDDM